MKNVVLIDLEKNPLQAKTLRAYIEHDQLVYLFNLTVNLTILWKI
jgi:hypothetical protein